MNRILVSILSLLVTYSFAVRAAEIKLAPKNISDNATYYQVEFGTYSSSDNYELPAQYLQLGYTPFVNVPLWKIDIYTNNTNSTLAQRGGIVNIDNPNYRIPIIWKVSNSTDASLSGDPSMQGAGWQWLKDKNDIDVPDTAENESWPAARNDGYTSICSGDNNGIVLIDGTHGGTTAYVYLKGAFSGAAAGNYNGTVWFDMYPLIDQNPPVFTHEPEAIIVGRRNMFIIKGIATDDEKITYVKLHYSTDISTWQTVNLGLLGSKSKKAFLYSKKLNEFGDISKVFYFLETSDGYNVSWFGSENNPQTVEISDRVTFLDITKGLFEVPDGNPEDGATGISIPDGALSRVIMLTIMPADINMLNKRKLHDTVSDSPVMAYEFGPEGVKFNKPVTLTLRYLDLDDDGIVELEDGTKTNIKEIDLKVYWWDSFEWRLIGGKVDTVMNTITIPTDHFSTYAIFAQPPMTVDDYRPKEKFITPATPGGDDVARFNGLTGNDFKIDLFDVTGRKFRSIASPQLAQWDGKDEDGNIVESGVYIYQFEADVNGSKKLISGTIVVAK